MAAGYSVWCTPHGVQARLEGSPRLSPEFLPLFLRAQVSHLWLLCTARQRVPLRPFPFEMG